MPRRPGSSNSRREHPFAVDERLVMPETRFEVIEGKVVYVSPADQPHGSRHSKLSALLEAYVASGYDAASDMLTRTSDRGDMAPDGSIYPVAPDPKTGGRRIEELAFEVVSTEALSAAGTKAAALIGRGVRRVFALDVARQRALEWSRRTNTWQILPGTAVIEDSVLALPLPVYDLVSAASADDAVARALLAKKNPVLVQAVSEGKAEGIAEGKAEGIAEGIAEGKAQAIIAVLRSRGVGVTSAAERRIRSTRQPAMLDDWLQRAALCRTTGELFEAPKEKRATRKGIKRRR